MLETLRNIKRKIPFISKVRILKRKFDPKLAIHGGLPVSEYTLPTTPYTHTLKDSLYVQKIVVSGQLTHNTGNEIKSLEKEFADYIRVKYAVATNSGTSALMLACKAIGIRPGDEVIIPAYTFVACAQAVLAFGGIPIFADLDGTFNISASSLKNKITKKTKAVIIVHMFGNVADMSNLLRVAKKHNLFVIEDCAQAVGATYQGKKVGSLGDIGCFSLNEKKALPTGQGGILTTNNKNFFNIATISRDTGETWSKEVDTVSTGETYYMTEMQAALARRILVQLDMLNAKRRKNFRVLTKNYNLISDFATIHRVVKGAIPSFSRLAFIIDFKKLKVDRKFFISALNAEGIPVKTFYSIPFYNHSLFKKRMDLLTKNRYPFSLNKKLSYTPLPFVEKFCQNQVAMEFSPYLKPNDILNILKAFRKVAYYTRPSINIVHKQIQDKKAFFNVGIIGLGGISEVHIKALRENKKVNLAAFAEVDKSILDQRSKEFPETSSYSNYEGLLKNKSVNVVDILLPHHLHLKAISDSLEANKIVICEKPLVTNIKDLKSLQKAIKKTNGKVFVKHYLRSSKLYNDARNIIQGGSLGKAYLVNCIFTVNSTSGFQNLKDWKTNIKEGGGGVLMDNGIHLIDFLIYVFGKPKSVFSTSKRISTRSNKKGEDVSITTIEFDDNVLANLVCTAVDTSTGFKWENRFFTTNGQILLESFGRQKATLKIIKDKNVFAEKTEANWWENANIQAINNIIERISRGATQSVDFKDIQYAIEVVQKAYESSKTGKKIYLGGL